MSLIRAQIAIHTSSLVGSPTEVSPTSQTTQSARQSPVLDPTEKAKAKKKKRKKRYRQNRKAKKSETPSSESSESKDVSGNSNPVVLPESTTVPTLGPVPNFEQPTTTAGRSCSPEKHDPGHYDSGAVQLPLRPGTGRLRASTAPKFGQFSSDTSDDSKSYDDHLCFTRPGQPSSAQIADQKGESKVQTQPQSSDASSQSSSESTTDPKGKSKVQNEPQSSTTHGHPPPGSYADPTSRSDIQNQPQSSTTHDQSSSHVRSIPGDDSPNPSEDYKSNVVEPQTEEESSVGKYDLLVGDPNLDFSEKKNKGRVESITPYASLESTNKHPCIADDDEGPRFQVFVPGSEFKVGSSSRQSFNSETSTPPEIYVPPKIGVPSSTYFATSLAKIEPERSKRAPTAARCDGSSHSRISSQFIQKGKKVTRSSKSPRSNKLSRKPVATGPLPPIPKVSSPPAAREVMATTGSSAMAQIGSSPGEFVTPGGAAGSYSTEVVTVHRSSDARRARSHSHPDGYVQCAKVECNVNCDLWDGVSVICPKCGPYSEVRYCTQEHLRVDAKWHWVWCGKMTITHPYRELIARQVRERVPLMPCLHFWDTPERHRQALYFNIEREAGDYFIFADWADFREAGFPEDTLPLRCSPRIVKTVRFDDPEEKDRFRRVLAVMLFCKYLHPYLPLFTQTCTN